MTSYKRPCVCPGVVKNFSINFEVSLSDPNICFLSGYSYENYSCVNIVPVDIQDNVYRINNLEDAGKVGLQFMSLHLIRRIVGGGLSVTMAMKSFMYSITSHPHTSTDLKYWNVALIN